MTGIGLDQWIMHIHSLLLLVIILYCLHRNKLLYNYNMATCNTCNIEVLVMYSCRFLVICTTYLSPSFCVPLVGKKEHRHRYCSSLCRNFFLRDSDLCCFFTIFTNRCMCLCQCRFFIEWIFELFHRLHAYALFKAWVVKKNLIQ